MAKFKKEDFSLGGKLFLHPIFNGNHSMRLRCNAAIGLQPDSIALAESEQSLHQFLKHFTEMLFHQKFPRREFWKLLARHSIFMLKSNFGKKFNFTPPCHRVFCITVFPKLPNILKYFRFSPSIFPSSKKIKKLPKAAKLHLEYVL
ncbi:MAG: hypothetical protein BHW65_00030 [Verrucomicrobia bacterium CAG:312_58_20]|nr:MAG: hypothetical protein BHW65_00030 [Verrucomicrobia bacterium CAG:312_58_20]